MKRVSDNNALVYEDVFHQWTNLLCSGHEEKIENRKISSSDRERIENG